MTTDLLNPPGRNSNVRFGVVAPSVSERSGKDTGPLQGSDDATPTSGKEPHPTGAVSFLCVRLLRGRAVRYGRNAGTV